MSACSASRKVQQTLVVRPSGLHRDAAKRKKRGEREADAKAERRREKQRLRTMGCGLWAVGCGLWVVEGWCFWMRADWNCKGE